MKIRNPFNLFFAFSYMVSILSSTESFSSRCALRTMNATWLHSLNSTHFSNSNVCCITVDCLAATGGLVLWGSLCRGRTWGFNEDCSPKIGTNFEVIHLCLTAAPYPPPPPQISFYVGVALHSPMMMVPVCLSPQPFCSTPASHLSPYGDVPMCQVCGGSHRSMEMQDTCTATRKIGFSRAMTAVEAPSAQSATK